MHTSVQKWLTVCCLLGNLFMFRMVRNVCRRLSHRLHQHALQWTPPSSYFGMKKIIISIVIECGAPRLRHHLHACATRSYNSIHNVRWWAPSTQEHSIYTSTKLTICAYYSIEWIAVSLHSTTLAALFLLQSEENERKAEQNIGIKNSFIYLQVDGYFFHRCRLRCHIVFFFVLFLFSNI